VITDQLQGIPVHNSAVSQQMPVLSAAQVALRRVPKHTYGLEAMIIGANLLALGTPRHVVRLLVDDLWYYLQEEGMLQSPIWRLYAKHPNLAKNEVYNWFWEAYEWNGRVTSLASKPGESAAYHILGYTVTRRPMDESESERNLWYKFCLDQWQRQGKQFRLLGRNEERVEKQYRAFWLKYLQTLQGAVPEWEASSFPGWKQEVPQGTYRIEELRSESALRLEGLLMQHCVESYVEQCRKGLSSIWSLRWYSPAGECTPLVTIELKPTGRIVQAYGKCNIRPKAECQGMIKNWKDTFQ